ncbi:unnamed protein product [Symbiodinium necroappetens]|uniref:Uncharacterized protein n=1 Tax=Symbiodinium necroappetens TaxID=1628268 RepID=A0A812J4Q0_9DINO|nr:unnamed protein product [Symbiodinium necroappetens]
MAIGSAVGNAAVVVGNHVVKTAKTSLNSLPETIKSAANHIGEHAVGVAAGAVGAVPIAGEMVVDTTVDLAGTALAHAEDSLQGLGRLATRLAETAWNEIKKIVDCLKEMVSLCSILIGDQCDCNGGSHVTIATDHFSVRCVFQTTSEFSKGFGINAVRQNKMDGTTLEGLHVLPGDEFVEAYKTAGQVLKSQDALKDETTSGTSSSCETALDVAIDGIVQFSPDVTFTVYDSGTTVFSISGMVRTSVQALVEAQGSCSFKAMRGFPDPPKKKVICGGKFCIVIMLQMVAELNLEGTLTGTLEVSTEADFEIAGTVRVTSNGHADVDMNTPGIAHKQGFAIGASATASARVSMGPVLTIWPVPGIPITVRPMVHAEAKAQGTLNYESAGHGLLFVEESDQVSAADASNSSLNMTSNTLQMCGAAALNIYADVDVTGFALPAIFRSHFDSDVLVEELTRAVTASADALVRTIVGPLQCMPGANTVAAVVERIRAAARAAADHISALIPTIDFDLGLPSIQLLSPKKLFCKEVYTTPDDFESAPCAAELGCKHAGRRPPPGEELPEPEQVTSRDTRASGTGTCPALVMGDRFIQLGNTWRLCDIDGVHFVLQHNNPREVPIVWRNDGRTFWRPWELNSHWSQKAWAECWSRASGPSKGISFGFQFIQIGEFRIGANDDDHFSVGHSSHTCPQTWRGHDTSVHHGTGWDIFDRGEGFPTGVTFGDRFVQVGKMRFGASDDNHFTFFFTPTGRSMEIFRGHDGTRHAGNSYWNHHNHMVHRLPAHWTCPDFAEKAYGKCNPEFGHWGDRFIQIGKWRLAAIDANNLSISHKDGKTAQVYRNDGHILSGPRTDYSAWDRPIGFPHGIAFGPSFIQIGNFRIAAMDHNHMSITHISGPTAQVFRGHDGSLHPNVPHAWNAWSLRAGPATGVTFGDRFIQLGEFRIGEGGSLYVTHTGYNKSPQIFRADGQLVSGTQHHYAHIVNDRHAMWHCGGIQGIMGTCPGITVGDGFLQISDWRLAGRDERHFSFSHRSIHTPLLCTSDSLAHSGPRRDWHSWHLEANNANTVKFGDRFIQFGHWWRLGEWELNGRHFVLIHRNYKVPIVWRDDGTVHNGPVPTWEPTSSRVASELNLFRRAIGAPSGIAFGHGFVQIGKWRIGDVDSHHFSITVSGQTAEVFTADARRHSGPRTDWTTFGRPISDCQVVPSDFY